MPRKKKKTKTQQYIEMGWDEIVRFKAKSAADMKQLRNIVNALRREFNKRMGEFEEQGEYSYAGDKFQGTGKTAAAIIKNMKPDAARNTLIQELASYKSFFDSRSSTLEGIREINREQDARIFGLNEFGQIKGTLTTDERKAYWALYSEFERSHGADIERQSSKRIQQVVADFMAINPNAADDLENLPHIALLQYMEDLGYATPVKPAR